MNGIKMSDCRFYVNEAERTVVCVLPEWIDKDGKRVRVRDMLTNFIHDNFTFSDLDLEEAIQYWNDNKFAKALEMPRTFVGKAVCAPGDEWNEELGRKIAFSRAKDKCYKSFFKRANLFVQTVDRRLGDMIERFNDFGLKLETKREALHSEIDKAIQPEE
jgi:hypothetical protein